MNAAIGPPLATRWFGGANLPTLGGSRINGSEPFAVLTLAGDSLELRLCGPLVKLTRSETLQVVPTALEVVFPIRSRVRFRGVGFRRPDGREYYFKTRKIDEILDRLRAAGFPVSAEAREATKIWGLAP